MKLLVLLLISQISLADTTERCGVGSGVGVCDYIGDRGSQTVRVSCDGSKITVINAAFGPQNYPVQCGGYVAQTCNGLVNCMVSLNNTTCEASGVLPASTLEQVVFVSCAE